MAPLIGAALIGGGASLLGGLMGSSGAKKQNAANLQIAREAQAFEAQQTATAHQREVADLRAAGLNPVLSGTGGMGAASAKGIMAQQANVMEPLDRATNAGAHTAMQAARTHLELKNLKETNRNIEEDSDLKRAQRILTNRDDNVRSQDERLRILQNDIGAESLREARAHANMAEDQAKGTRIEGDIDSTTWGKALRYINRANPLGATGSSAVRAIKAR